MSELPPGWASATVANLVARDGTFSDGDWVESKDQDPTGAIRLLQLADVGDGLFVDKSNRFVNYEKFEQLRCTEVFEGDVLIARMPDPLGRACLAPKLRQRCITVVDVAIVRPGPSSVMPKWLMHFLNAPPVRERIELQSSGTTRQRISRGNLGQLELPVPPLPEQKRIADKLDALLARAYACRERLDRVPAILKRFRQSVLAAATSGELTREWREAHGVSAEWSRSSVAAVAVQVFDGPFGSNLKSSDYVDSGIRVVRLENIAPLRFIENKRTYISQEKYEGLARHTLLANDILFSSFVDEEVRVCLVPEELSGRAINKADCFCIRVNAAKCRPIFLALQLGCRTTFEGLEDMVHGATRPRINLGQLRAIQFRLPSVDEQEEVVQRSAALLQLADNLERRLGVVRGHIARTTPSALAKAFRGELVPQDPNEEHASKLLAQIDSRTTSHGTDGRPKRSGARGPSTKTKAQTDMLTRKDVTSTHLTSILKERGALTAEALWNASQLDIDEFYDQLKDEEARGLLRESRGDSPTAPRVLEAAT